MRRNHLPEIEDRLAKPYLERHYNIDVGWLVAELKRTRKDLLDVVDAADCMWAYAADYASEGTKLEREVNTYKDTRNRIMESYKT